MRVINRLCYWPGCNKKIQVGHLMCNQHWKELSSPLREKIAKAQQRGNYGEIIQLLPNVQNEVRSIKQ